MYLGKDIEVLDNISTAIWNIHHQQFDKLPLGLFLILAQSVASR